MFSQSHRSWNLSWRNVNPMSDIQNFLNWMTMTLRSLWVNLLTSKLQWPGRINKTHVPIQQIFLYLKMMI